MTISTGLVAQLAVWWPRATRAEQMRAVIMANASAPSGALMLSTRTFDDLVALYTFAAGRVTAPPEFVIWPTCHAGMLVGGRTYVVAPDGGVQAVRRLAVSEAVAA